MACVNGDHPDGALCIQLSPGLSGLLGLLLHCKACLFRPGSPNFPCAHPGPCHTHLALACAFCTACDKCGRLFPFKGLSPGKPRRKLSGLWRRVAGREALDYLLQIVLRICGPVQLFGREDGAGKECIVCAHAFWEGPCQGRVELKGKPCVASCVRAAGKLFLALAGTKERLGCLVAMGRGDGNAQEGVAQLFPGLAPARARLVGAQFIHGRLSLLVAFLELGPCHKPYACKGFGIFTDAECLEIFGYPGLSRSLCRGAGELESEAKSKAQEKDAQKDALGRAGISSPRFSHCSSCQSLEHVFLPFCAARMEQICSEPYMDPLPCLSAALTKT